MSNLVLQGQRVRLLEVSLYELISKHTLPEVLDRLAHLVDSESNSEDEPEIKEALEQVVLHLERATTVALQVENLKR